MNAGAAGVAEIAIVMFGVTAAGLTPLLAVTLNEKGPVVVGVPDSTPLAEFKVKPPGSAPDVTANVGVGLPLAVNV